MKKFIVIFWSVIFPWVSFAGTADLFSYNKLQVDQAFVSIDAVDHFVSIHKVGIDEIIKSNPVAVNLLDNSSEEINLFDKGPDSLFGIPPFWWGFFLNWVGALLVYILTEHNKEYTRDAIIGFLVGTVIYVGGWFCWAGCWAWY
jgi:hypothetical protein